MDFQTLNSLAEYTQANIHNRASVSTILDSAEKVALAACHLEKALRDATAAIEAAAADAQVCLARVKEGAALISDIADDFECRVNPRLASFPSESIARAKSEYLAAKVEWDGVRKMHNIPDRFQ